MRILKTAVIVVAALAATAGTSIVASAYPPPKEHHSIDCDPGHVSAKDGSCSVTFVDKEQKTTTTTTSTAAIASLEGRANQKVCFTVVKGPGTVTPACTTTNSKGKAFATYNAGDSVKCSGKDPDGTKAVIRGKESADDNGSAQTTVRVTCPNKDKKPHNNTAAASTSSSAHGPTTNARNTAALLSTPTTSPGGLALGGGILVLIVILSVAITGRLRLRGLRR
jgi:hypothetical protein